MYSKNINLKIISSTFTLVPTINELKINIKLQNFIYYTILDIYYTRVT